MERTAVLFVLLSFCITSLALECKVVPGSVKQIDVWNGIVYGVNSNNQILALFKQWLKLEGSWKHVSVGPAGTWGVNANNRICKNVGGRWIQFKDLMKQIDAGGKYIAGVNMNNEFMCISESSSWTIIPEKLKYVSCGPYSCWGVNAADNIFILKGLTPTACGGSLKFEKIPGSLSMIDVSTDGKVFGVNSNGDVYQRDGVSQSNPVGTGWRQVPSSKKVKHVSYGNGHLWLIGRDDSIMDCSE
ncbi:fish-egg lectin-like isoform X5 [Colossoma macropomum]|uniref:fish-egg lectin-like isoform X5 n=1 Tax=Colossoma macropomum TaxID=42526 RepID=UPI00186519E6|nr:fish-egg lectin-like isoform X5 [Colossoma macropomum]